MECMRHFSFDEGKPGPVKSTLTDGTYRFLNGGLGQATSKMDSTHAEPRGYLAAVQSPTKPSIWLAADFITGFNLAWLMEARKIKKGDSSPYKQLKAVSRHPLTNFVNLKSNTIMKKPRCKDTIPQRVCQAFLP